MSLRWIVGMGLVALGLSLSGAVHAQTGLREALKDIEVAPHWIYNDLPKAMAEARQTGKPLLVVLRCVPCPPGRNLDMAVMQPDRQLEELEKKFVCVRVIQTNGLDLQLFQYDYDMSWSAVMMNADRTIYGRYGTRTASGPESDSHLNRAAFLKTLQRVLELHAAYPANKEQLAGKTGPAPEYARPELIPGLEDRGPVATTRQSCIHCHMVKEYTLRAKWMENKLSASDLYVFPMPDNLGMTIDDQDGRIVNKVVAGSLAAAAGIQAGDELLSLDNQPLTSLADIQWALHRAPNQGELPAVVRRGDTRLEKTIRLGGNWKQSDIAWRASSWYGLRQGIKFESLSAEEKAKRGLPADSLAVLIRDMFGKGAPKLQEAGLRKGDVIIAADDRTKTMSDSEFLVFLRLDHGPGDSLKLKVLRGDKRLDYELPLW